MFFCNKLLEEVTTTSSNEEEHTLSTDLVPPPYPQKEEHQYMVFVINLFGLKNASGETSDEMFENDVIKNVPELTGD